MTEPYEHCQCDNCSGADCGQDNPEQHAKEQEVLQKKRDWDVRMEVLSELGKMLNSKIAAMEIVCSKKSTPLREGILMAYREIENWEREMQKGKP